MQMKEYFIFLKALWVLSHNLDTSYIWPIDGTLTSTTTTGQIGPRSNDSVGVLQFLQNFGTGASLSDEV